MNPVFGAALHLLQYLSNAALVNASAYSNTLPVNSCPGRIRKLSYSKASNRTFEVKIKQEDLATAAGKLAECQKTTASLGQQLKYLATLEDFLIDTTIIPELPKEIQSLQQLMRIRTMETHPIDCVVESCQFQEEQKRV
ncbi:hypothetical protein V6N13_120737 [Hibiscus sabdariffa]|uniref:Uncharacterized protein n=1 Tax=Hibiscus sabdariffa TaxID=183260 RepID=A0ABR2E5S5_9ROSI